MRTHHLWPVLGLAAIGFAPGNLIAQVQSERAGSGLYQSLDYQGVQALIDSMLANAATLTGSTLVPQDTIGFTVSVQDTSRVVMGSIGIGEDAAIPDSMSASDYFGASTVLIAANLPSLALLDSSEADGSWVEWAFRAGSESLDAFTLEVGPNRNRVFTAEAGAASQALRVLPSGVLQLSEGIRSAGGGVLRYGFPDTTGLAPGAMAFWNGETLDPLVGEDGDELHWCSGRPTWGPCPPPTDFAWGNLAVSVVVDGGIELSAPVLEWGSAPVYELVFIQGMSPDLSDGDTTSVEFDLTANAISRKIELSSDASPAYFRFATRTATGWKNSLVETATTPPSTFACGDSIAVGTHTYGTAVFADRCWFTENLKATSFLDGTTLDLHANATDWAGATSEPGIAYLNFDQATHGSGSVFYNSAALLQASTHFGLCPLGWRIAERDDWQAAIAVGEFGMNSALALVNTSYFNGSSWTTPFPQGSNVLFDPYTWHWANPSITTPLAHVGPFNAAIDLPYIAPISKFGFYSQGNQSNLAGTIRCVQ